MDRFIDLIRVCEGRIRLGPGEYPASDYPWSFKEVASVNELIEAFRHGNWSARTGFVLGNLAFVEQVSGGNEWLALKKDAGEWKTFESISFSHMLERKGDDYCHSFINSLQKTPWWNLKHPENPINDLDSLREISRKIEERTGGKQQFAGDFTGRDVYISADENANAGMIMRKNLDCETGLCRLEFQGYIRRMGVYMSAVGMQAIADEAGQIADILAELEQNPITVTEGEIAQWSKELAGMEFERTITEMDEMEHPLDHTMGMM